MPSLSWSCTALNFVPLLGFTRTYSITQTRISRSRIRPIPWPFEPTDDFTQTSDLVFNYADSPFAFWIILYPSEPDALSLFDTRISLFPPTRVAPTEVWRHYNFHLGWFPLVLEDHCLQLTYMKRPTSTKLGEVYTSSGFRRDIETDAEFGILQIG